MVFAENAMKPEGLQYQSCPQLQKESAEDRGVRHLTSKYDSYHGLLLQQQRRRRRVSSLDGSETATDISSNSSSSTAEERLQVTEQERFQVETFFRGLKTQVRILLLRNTGKIFRLLENILLLRNTRTIFRVLEQNK